MESGHPLSDDVKRHMYIDQRNISHIITKVWWEGNRVLGEIETAQTAAGNDMAGLIRQGSRVAFSMRGMSKAISKDGQYQRVSSPLNITCYDWVVIPSHHDSYMKGKLSEGVRIGSNAYASLTESINTPAHTEEGNLNKIDTSELLEFIMNKSDNQAYLSESLGITSEKDVENVQVVNESIKAFLSSDITSDLNSFYKNL